MTGTYENGKMAYANRSYPHLTGGNWETGFSRVHSSYMHDEGIQHLEIINPAGLIEGRSYDFEIENGKAKIKSNQ